MPYPRVNAASVALAGILVGCSACGGGPTPLFQASPGSPIAVAGGPGNVALGDLDGDGKLDLVVACGKGKSVPVFLGQGDGRFRPAPGGPVKLADGPGDMVLSDLNGDGKLDLAVAHHDSYGVTLL